MEFNPQLLYADLLLTLVMTGFLFAAWRFNRDFKGLREWLTGFALATVNLSIFITAPPIPPTVSLLLLDALLMGAGLFAFFGASRYIGVPIRHTLHVVFLALTVLISAIALLKTEHGNIGFILASLVSGGYCVIAGLRMIRGGLQLHPFRYLLALSIVFHGVFLLCRPLLFTESMQLLLDLTLKIEAMDFMVFEQIILSPILAMSVLLLINEDRSILLRVRAEYDFLTEVRNRGSFFEQLAKAASLSSRLKTPLSVLVIDLDHFKAINDRYGHQAGDEILRSFVKVARGCIRNEDDIGRLGGEEFGIFLMNTPLNQAALIAERLRATVESSPITFGAETIGYTISAGIAAYQEELGINRTVDRADQFLYFAKNKGRNRVEPQTPDSLGVITSVI